MKVYLFDKDTLIYTGERDAVLDVLETQRAGKEVYAKPYNGTFVKPEQKDGMVPVYNIVEDNWGLMNSVAGKYILNTKTGTLTYAKENRVVRTYECVIDKELYTDLALNPDKYVFEDGEIKDISKTQEYENKQLIKKYEQLIREAKEKYDTFLSTPVKFQGKTYLPRYIDDYATLQFRSFPREIWDSTGMNSTLMSKAEFARLKEYLENLVDEAFKEKKESIKRYKKEIEKLGEQL